MPRPVFLAIFAALLLAPGVYAQNSPEFSVTDTDPGLSQNLGKYSPLYLRFRYRSDVPIRARARGYLSGAPAEQGASFNPAPPYPAGDGEGIVWLSFDRPARIDEIRIEVFDARWQPMVTHKQPVNIAWTGLADGERKRPEWVKRLSDTQQQATTESLQNGNDGAFGWLIGLLVTLGVPGYFVLQLLLGIRWSGGWRIAALAPLLLMLPAFGHAAFALTAGSNIWPIVVILVAPFACLYLGGLFIVRRVVAA